MSPFFGDKKMSPLFWWQKNVTIILVTKNVSIILVKWIWISRLFSSTLIFQFHWYFNFNMIQRFFQIDKNIFIIFDKNRFVFHNCLEMWNFFSSSLKFPIWLWLNDIFHFLNSRSFKLFKKISHFNKFFRIHCVLNFISFEIQLKWIQIYHQHKFENFWKFKKKERKKNYLKNVIKF